MGRVTKVKVRIPVVFNRRGEWSSWGSSENDEDDAVTEAAMNVCDDVQQFVAFVEAEIQIPEENIIQAEIVSSPEELNIDFDAVIAEKTELVRHLVDKFDRAGES